MPNSLQSQTKYFPIRPGCYLFKDKLGVVLYVGKAKNLKSRVRQYFGQDKRPQLPFLIDEARSVEYLVANTELESLYLENNLIKKYQPKYNIKLKDDKNYAFITINYSAEIPQIGYVRKVSDVANQDFKSPSASWGSKQNSKFQILNSNFFGPYSSTKKVKDTLDLVRKIFPYCSNLKVSDRPCFYFHLHRCPGVCVGKISLAEYKNIIQRIKLFLSGRLKEVKKDLQTQMRIMAAKKQFELAARLRDQLRALDTLEQKQIAQFPKPVNFDFLATASATLLSCVNVLKVREGKLIDRESFFYQTPSLPQLPDGSLHQPHDVSRKADLLQKFCEEYYQDATDLPAKIYLETTLPNPEIIALLLASRTKKRISHQVPSRGKAKQLLKLSQLNAEEQLRKNLASDADNLDKLQEALTTLKDVLALPHLPRRIECYDISNTQGTNSVASMVVFQDGKPAKSEYRKFIIRHRTPTGGPDDFAMMQETLKRRFQHLPHFGQPKYDTHLVQSRINDQGLKVARPWPRPDLIVIDGGKGQLNAALKAAKLETLNSKSETNSKQQAQNSVQKTQTNSRGLVKDEGFPPKAGPPLAERIKDNAIPMLGLAKRIEEIFLPGKSKPIILPHTSPALQLLQRLRDEAHRFAITFHRQKRGKLATRSALDDISGIGPKTKKLLKKHFGTLSDIKKANPEELEKIVGKSKTKLIKSQL